VNAMLAFIILLTALRLMERAFDRSRPPFDPFDRITDYRRHFDRQPRDEAVGKVTYDPIADEQVRRVQDRRRKPNIDNGMRRRKEDRS